MRTITDPFDTESADEAAVRENDVPMTITTTLYDLIAAVRDGVGPDDDNLVVATTVRILSSRWVTFLGDMEASRRFVGVELQGYTCQPDTLDITQKDESDEHVQKHPYRRG